MPMFPKGHWAQKNIDNHWRNYQERDENLVGEPEIEIASDSMEKANANALEAITYVPVSMKKCIASNKRDRNRNRVRLNGRSKCKRFIGEHLRASKHGKLVTSNNRDHLSKLKKEKITQLLQKHEALLQGKRGKYKEGGAELRSKPGAKTCDARSRPIPLPQRREFKKELGRQCSEGILRKLLPLKADESE